MRKKIEHYSYGLHDYIEKGKKSSIFRGSDELSEKKVAIKVIDVKNK